MFVFTFCAPVCEVYTVYVPSGKDFNIFQVMQNCRNLRVLDLSYMFTGYKTELTNENHQCFASLPDTVTELSLSGIQLKDSAILVSAVTKLTCLRILRLCGVPVLDDTTLTEVTYEKNSCLIFIPSIYLNLHRSFFT